MSHFIIFNRYLRLMLSNLSIVISHSSSPFLGTTANPPPTNFGPVPLCEFGFINPVSSNSLLLRATNSSYSFFLYAKYFAFTSLSSDVSFSISFLYSTV